MVAFIQKAHGCIFLYDAIKAQEAQLAISDSMTSAAAWRRRTTGDDNEDDVDGDGDGAMGSGATGYNDDDNDDGDGRQQRRRRWRNDDDDDDNGDGAKGDGIQQRLQRHLVKSEKGRGLLECLTAACKALSLANGKGKGTNGLEIGSLD